MKKRFSEEQIRQSRREAEPPGSHWDVCGKSGVAEQTFSHWCRKDQGLRVPELQRLKRRESANAKLKRWVAEQALAIPGLQALLPNTGLP
jgi:putative transposase